MCHRVTATEFLKRPVVEQYKENEVLSLIGPPGMGKHEFSLARCVGIELRHLICAGS